VLDFEVRGSLNIAASAANLLADSDGRQLLLATIPQKTGCGLQLVTMPLSTRMFSSALPLAACGQAVLEVNVGCAKLAAYCVISTFKTGNRVLLMHSPGSRIEQLVKTNPVIEPRAALSPDASLAVFDSGVGMTSHASIANLKDTSTRQD